MTKEEAKAAIDLEYPVSYQGIKYTKIVALIYRRRNGQAIATSRGRFNHKSRPAGRRKGVVT